MKILQKLALIFMMLLFFAVPTDGVGYLGNLPLVKVAGLLTFGVTILMVIMGAELRGMAWFLIFSLLYIAWAIFSFLWTTMPIDYVQTAAINSQQSIKAHLYLLMIVLLMFQVIRNEPDLQWVLFAFLLGSFLLVILAIQNYNPGVITVRHQIEGIDSNEMSVQLAMVIPLGIYLLSLGRYLWMRFIAMLYIPLAMLTIIITGSRTGFVVLLLGMLGFIPLMLRSGWLIRWVGVMSLLITGLVVSQMVPERTLERIFSTGSELSQGTLSERTAIWKSAYQEWQEKPFFGHGMGAFKRIVNRYNIDYTAHNSYISIAVEQGVIGLLLYVSVVWLTFFYAWQQEIFRRLLLLTLLLIIAASQLTLTLHENMYVWFAYVLAALSLRPGHSEIAGQERRLV